MNFDAVIIGSSPLMLMQARKLASQGRSVCVVDGHDSLGGSWQLQGFSDIENLEVASHVIEFFPNVYDALESASGVEFVVLDPQPIRVHTTGLIVPYHSRPLVLMSGIRMIVGYVTVLARKLIGKAYDRNDLINFRQKLSSYFKFQLSSLFHKAKLKGPASGFADYLLSLIESCKQNGVAFETFRVAEAKRDKNGWVLLSEQLKTITATQIYATTSATLRHAEPGLFVQDDTLTAMRHGQIISIPLADIHTNHFYAAFWSDPLISRISRVDQPHSQSDAQIFLVELRRPLDEKEDAHSIIQERLLKASILNAPKPFELLGGIACSFTSNVGQLNAGEIDTDFFTLHSAGNLAAGVARWLSHQ